jgi:hypothetical protein
MHKVKSFPSLQTITDNSVNVGDIMATDQIVAKRMEMRNESSVV